jgi:hypothetical protein
VTLSNTAGMGQTLYTCPGNMIITPNGSAIVCPSSSIIKNAKDGIITYSTGFPEFSAATGHLTRTVGHWPTSQQRDPSVTDLLWSDASGRMLIGVINSAGRYWVGVISGNEFTPLNAQWAPATYEFGAW